jgi:L-ribulose-5-phosphate 3-epimerase UlaE
LQVHGAHQAHEAQVMIAMKVTDENMIDAVEANVVTVQLDKRAFTTVNEK